MMELNEQVRSLFQTDKNCYEFTLPFPSAGGRPITGWHLRGSEAEKRLLLLGGVHGDESEGIVLAERFLAKLKKAMPVTLDIVVVPRFNPDGSELNQRKNGNGVDLNRNMPTKDWTRDVKEEKYYPGEEAASEPETKLMMALIEEYKPEAIVSCHSWKPLINFNGPARELGEYMARANDYQVVGDIGYPTPGSLGTWAGWEREIPTITFEAERGLSPDINWQVNGKALDYAVEWLLEN
jgi:protein MpaA